MKNNLFLQCFLKFCRFNEIWYNIINVMKTINYEQRALIWGIGINTFSAIIGTVFFIVSNSQTLFLDAFISIILVLSTFISLLVSRAIKKKSEDYPLGKWAIENIFLLFRATLLILIILMSITDGIQIIVNYLVYDKVEIINISLTNLLIYAILMILSCIAITIVYSYYNRKLENPSPMIKLEIKASIYDGLVTLVATSSLLIFYNVEALAFMKAIGDSITVIVLSLIYLVAPIKEINDQIKILSDKRRYKDEEKRIKIMLEKLFSMFNIHDIYFSYSGETTTIYLALLPKKNLESEQISEEFGKIRSRLLDNYPNAKIFILLTKKKIHNL